MKRLTAAVLCALGIVCAALAFALTGLETVFLDPARYAAIQDELNVYPSVGIAREEQLLIDGDLAAYLAGKSDSLARPVTLRGEAVSCAFNARELAHMEDVRRLFEKGFALRRALAVCAVVFLLVPLILRDRKAWGRGLLGALIISAAAGIAAFLLLRAADFDRLFIRFHELVFSNDLWLLNPETDAMIRMLPDGFFDRMALSGSIRALLFALLPFAVGGAILPITSKRSKKRKLPILWRKK